MPAAAPRRRKPPPIQRRAPRQDRAHATVEAVLEATARIVRHAGVAGLNTNRIAERAGISVGTLYGYFPDKAAILVALARRILADDERALRAALDTDPAGEPIRSVIRGIITRHRTDRGLRRAVMGVHIGAGHGAEHGASVERSVMALLERSGILFGERGPPGRLQTFVATRAALGVARALVDEADDLASPALEDELVRLIYGYLGLA